jgi:hypothetical protein
VTAVFAVLFNNKFLGLIVIDHKIESVNERIGVSRFVAFCITQFVVRFSLMFQHEIQRLNTVSECDCMNQLTLLVLFLMVYVVHSSTNVVMITSPFFISNFNGLNVFFALLRFTVQFISTLYGMLTSEIEISTTRTHCTQLPSFGAKVRSIPSPTNLPRFNTAIGPC